MADLLDNLESGITRTVGAASRLLNQIKIIDEYMAAQRQSDLVTNGTAFPPPLSNAILPGSINHDSNPNIDPTLQNQITLSSAAQGVTFPTPSNPYDYTNPGSAVNGLGGTADEQFQFQLPAELLEGWPWPGDISQGFLGGGFMGY